MTEVKHTPGPWSTGDEVHTSRDYRGWEVPVFADDAESGDKMPAIAHATTREMAQANAALIAQAPTLLAERDALRAEVGKWRAALTESVDKSARLEAEVARLREAAEDAHCLVDELRCVENGIPESYQFPIDSMLTDLREALAEGEPDGR